jgi:hypothetical protein
MREFTRIISREGREGLPESREVAFIRSRAVHTGVSFLFNYENVCAFRELLCAVKNKKGRSVHAAIVVHTIFAAFRFNFAVFA